jgi:hypothetical protein
VLEDDMKNQIIGATLPLLLVAGLVGSQSAAQAQNPPPPASPEQTAPRAPATAAQATTMTLAGCLYREEQVPGRKPNVAERAGVLEDYILADASIAGGTKPGLISGATPASGNMYKVEGPSDERLKSLVGKRVEVTGRIDPEGGPGASPGAPRPDRGVGPDKINLPEFEATAIREISGTACPTAPAARK